MVLLRPERPTDHAAVRELHRVAFGDHGAVVAGLLDELRGTGSALVRAGLQEMAERGVPVVFLEGDPAYYGRLGFAAGAGLGFRRPSLRIPEPAFQAALLPAYEPWMTGTHVYAEAFWRHDAVGLRDPSA